MKTDAGFMEVFRTDPDAQTLATGRQVLLMHALIPKLDALIVQAAQARVPAPGLIEMREWAEYCLTEIACKAVAALDVKPDAVKDAVAGSVAAARSGDPVAYVEARALEALARAAA